MMDQTPDLTDEDIDRLLSEAEARLASRDSQSRAVAAPKLASKKQETLSQPSPAPSQLSGQGHGLKELSVRIPGRKTANKKVCSLSSHLGPALSIHHDEAISQHYMTLGTSPLWVYLLGNTMITILFIVTLTYKTIFDHVFPCT
jgi:hypothetical protein